MGQEGPIKTVIADSTNKNSVAAALAELAVERFDVIIDDGLHTQHAQLDTAGVLLGALDLQGVYIIEDIRRPESLLRKLKQEFPTHTFHLEPFAKLRPKKRLLDSNVIVFSPENHVLQSMVSEAVCEESKGDHATSMPMSLCSSTPS